VFEHKDRTNFVDLLRPPVGYRLESAVGTTYSLDFVALTATLLALIDVDGDEQDSPAQQIDTLHAITRLADRIRVFVNRGRISGPKLLSRVTAIYDRVIREVSFPEGMFHPKVWVLHYRPRLIAGREIPPSLLRVICASRNLATSQCWEAFVACEGRENKGKVAGAFNAEPSSKVAHLVDALNHTTFDLPRLMQTEGRFLWQWPGADPLKRHLPSKGRRALVVSPFIRKTFLESIVDRVEKVIVISTQHELDKISDEKFMSRLCGAGNRVYVVQPPDTEEELVMELHAKLLVFEDDLGVRTFLGSANASNSGWEGRNCEAVVKCSPGVSIDHFCDRFVFGERPAERGGRRPLRGWIAEYQRQPYVEDEDERAERYLEDVCAALARLTWQATYVKDERILQIRADTPPPQLAVEFTRWESDCEIGVALLSQLHSDAALMPLRGVFAGGLRFSDVGVADLTEFVVVDVADRKRENRKRFIIKVIGDFSESLHERDSALLQQLVTRDSLGKLMQAILFDAALRSPTSLEDGTGSETMMQTRSPLLSDLTIEDVLRSCTEDPSRIDEINHVLKAVEKTNLIDEEFRMFWKTFIAAEAEARNG